MVETKQCGPVGGERTTVEIKGERDGGKRSAFET